MISFTFIIGLNMDYDIDDIVVFEKFVFDFVPYRMPFADCYIRIDLNVKIDLDPAPVFSCSAFVNAFYPVNALRRALDSLALVFFGAGIGEFKDRRP